MRDIAATTISGTKRRLLIGCISTLVGLPAMAICLILIVTVLFPTLDKMVAGGNTNNAIYVILGVGLLAMIGMIAIPVVILVVQTIRRAHALDAVFIPLGLAGSSYMLYGRHYQGQIGGRAVDVYIYRGPSVEIRLQASVQTRLLAVPKGSLPTSVAWIFDKQPIATDDPALSAFSIYPLDQTWTGSLLADSRTGVAIQTLLALGADWAIFRRVEIQPGEVVLYLYRSRRVFGNSVDLNAAPVWLDALRSLAQVAEGLSAPQVMAQPVNAASRQSRQKMNKLLLYSIVFIVFIMPLCFIAVGVIAYLVVPLLR
jgi:hypothetical protein